MGVTLLALLLVPIAIAGGAFLLNHWSVSWKEFLLQVGVSLAVALLGWQVAKCAALSDVEHLNGRITNKTEGTQHCCHCTTVCTGRDKNGNCTSSYESCSHVWDHHWEIQTSVGEIQVQNCSGSSTPPKAWSEARVGDPAVVEHRYTNYLKADPDSLIVHSEHGPYLDRIPEYPKVFDYYRVNPVISDGVAIPAKWQEVFREMNADLGPSEQVDVTVLLTSITDPTYAQAVEAKWLYGPKNSLTIVLGVEADEIRWARVVTISRVEPLKVYLREALQGRKLQDPEVPDLIAQGVAKKFNRTPMSEFSYLARTATPTGWWLFGLYLVNIVVAILLTAIIHHRNSKSMGWRRAAPFRARSRNRYR